MKYQMKQCELKRRESGKLITQTAWIPSKFAIVGNYIKLMNSEINWKVFKVEPTALPVDYVDDRSQDYKRTRKASDI